MNGFLRTMILSCAASLAFGSNAYAMTDAQKQYACDRIMEALEKEAGPEAFSDQAAQEQIPTGVKAESLEEVREVKHYFDLLYYGGAQPIHFVARTLEERGFELCISAGSQAWEAVREHRRTWERLRALAAGLEGSAMEETLDNIYRYVIGHVDYFEDAKAPLYEALTEGRSTCAGYAALFERLCRLNGIPCAVVWGQDHAYNLVRLAGETVVYDPTFDAAAGYRVFSGRPLEGLVAWREDYYRPRLVEPAGFPVPLGQKGAVQ